MTLPQAIAVLGGVATFVSLLVFARNDGKRQGTMEAMATSVAKQLKDFGLTLERLNEKLDSDQGFRLADASWKAEHAGRLERAETDITRTRDHYHNDVVPKIQRALGLEERVRTLEGPRR